MIAIIKTKKQLFPSVLFDACIDYRYLGKNEFGDHYHEVNTRMMSYKMSAICHRHPYVMDYAYDVTEYKTRGARDFKLLYQELHPVALV